MKINFDVTNTNQNTDKVTISQGSIKTQGMGKNDAYALDISGKVMDNSAYGGQGRTAEIMQSAQQGYLAMQQDYMTVMSNFASEEDYAKLAEEGYKPGSVDIETIVTVVDEIKAKLAEAGIEIEGYNDDLSYGELKEITGSVSKGISIATKLKENDLPVTKENVEEVKKALDEANQLTQMSDSAKKYLVTNDSALSIAQVYRAQYSANSQTTRQAHGYYQDAMPGYYSKKADTYDWQQLNGQMEKVIENAGYEVNEETMNQAKWLVESGIELTPQTFFKLHEIENLEFPLSEEKVLNAIVNAFSSGKPAREADLSQNELLIDKAKQLMENVQSISEDAVRVVVEKEQPLTIKNLMNAMKQVSYMPEWVAEDMSQPQEQPLSLLTAKRQLEEVRLHMTVSANLRLLKSDYQIDTTELSRLVDELKAQEEKTKQILFKTEDPELLKERSAIYETTRSTIQEIPFKPAAVLGKLIWEDAPLTIRSVKEQGDALIKQYEQAGKSYETLMTAPRKDLGDSIQTAFRNVDDILTDMGYELTQANRKAVRILGYNNMEINDENMVRVKDAALAVDRVVENLTPASTLRLIRDGLNPLEMTVEELDNYLTGLRTADEKAEKYSEFLYKLEKNNEITQEERDAYIGIYRLMRQIEKSDGAVIGNLVRQGAELSFQNLLTALRTRQKGNVDYQIDDTKGAVGATVGISNSISAQIEKYYTRLSQDVLDHLEPKVMEALTDPSLSIEKADELLRESFAKDEANDELQKEQIQEFRTLNQVSEETVKTLMSYDVELTGDSLLSAELLFTNRSKAFDKLLGFELKEAAEQLKESLSDTETASEAYDDFVSKAEDVLTKEEEKTDNRLDLKAVRNIRKMLTIASKLAKKENYVVPLEANGEVISVNLQIVHQAGENGKVQITFSGEALGDVYAEFEVKSKGEGEDKVTLTGMIACSNKEGLNFLQQSADNMKVQLNNRGITSGEFYFSTGSELKLQKYIASGAGEFAAHKDADSDGMQEKVSNRTLYQVAKTFLTCLK